MLFKKIEVLIVELVAVTMAFTNMHASINFLSQRTAFYVAGIGTQTHGATFHGNFFLLFHHIDNRVFSIRSHFCRMCLLDTKNIPREFNDGHLHAQANPKKWKTGFPGVFYSRYFP